MKAFLQEKVEPSKYRPEFKPYKPPKVLMEQYQRAHEYHELPSLDVDKERDAA